MVALGTERQITWNFNHLFAVIRRLSQIIMRNLHRSRIVSILGTSSLALSKVWPVTEEISGERIFIHKFLPDLEDCLMLSFPLALVFFGDQPL
jgi:hypothetical protein